MSEEVTVAKVPVKRDKDTGHRVKRYKLFLRAIVEGVVVIEATNRRNAENLAYEGRFISDGLPNQRIIPRNGVVVSTEPRNVMGIEEVNPGDDAWDWPIDLPWPENRVAGKKKK